MSNWDPRKLIKWLNDKNFEVGNGRRSGLIHLSKNSATLRLFTYAFQAQCIVADDLIFDYTTNSVTMTRLRRPDIPAYDMKFIIREGNRTSSTVNIHWTSNDKGIIVSTKFFSEPRFNQTITTVFVNVWEIPVPLMDYIGDTCHSSLVVGKKVYEFETEHRKRSRYEDLSVRPKVEPSEYQTVRPKVEPEDYTMVRPSEYLSIRQQMEFTPNKSEPGEYYPDSEPDFKRQRVDSYNGQSYTPISPHDPRSKVYGDHLDRL